MVKMRIPIRAQLACLVLIASLIGLAVIAIATWVTTHSFVLNIRATRLSLTASLKSAQLASNLLLMQSTVKATATRVLIQSALQRFNNGNDTAANWKASESDLQAVFEGDHGASMLLQSQIFPVHDGVHSVMNATSPSMAGVVLPYSTPDGGRVTLGDSIYGFVPDLYPNFVPDRVAVNDTFTNTSATFEGRVIDANNYLLMGPYRVDDSLSMVSITMPIINNTSAADTLGWLTTVLDASLIFSVVDATEGLDDTGLTLLMAPNNATNKFANGVLYNSEHPTVPDHETVRFVTPPTNRTNVPSRHDSRPNDNNVTGNPFDWSKFAAVRKGFTRQTGAANNAGSAVSTRNEKGKHVAVGHAVVNTPMVDWLAVVEQAHSEVWAPIYNLRNIIVACVFGTIGALLLLAVPLAHIFSRPIRRLGEATHRTIASPSFTDDDDFPSPADGADEAVQTAQKEGFFDRIKHFRRQSSRDQAKRRDEDRGNTRFRIPGKVKDRKHAIHDELTDLTRTFNEMSDELMMQYQKLEERVQQRTAELEQSKKAAEAANESKTLFIANISHELKTPLNGILGMCAVCLSEENPDNLRRSLGIIYKSGDLLLNLLTDLLTFSKNQVGQQLALDERDFRLRDISAQVVAIFERQAKESEIELIVKFVGLTGATVDEHGRRKERTDFAPFGLGRLQDLILYGDQHRILQVVINLVSNSLKFTPRGGSISITIRCAGETSMSRKPSVQSRQSSQRNVKTRPRGSMSETGSVSASGPVDTANAINALEKPTAYSHMMAQESTAVPPPGRWLVFEFEVHDTGPGIPQHLQDKIFEPFVQGDLGLSKKYGGTGLGLSICSQLAGLMKGSIGLSSEPGRGSTFTMQISLKHIMSRADSTASSSIVNFGDTNAQPGSMDETRSRVGTGDDNRSLRSTTSNTAASGPVHDANPRLVGLSQPFFASDPPLDSATSQMAVVERVAAEATRSGSKVRMLVAEDNKTNQEVVLRMLKLEDVYDVTVAKDGQEALDKVKESMANQNPYNLVFMDVQMPNLDGLQSTRLIRQSGFNAPIVALTAYAEEQNVKECYDSGMNFFLSKPIRRPALKHVLKKYCPTIPEEGETTDAAAPAPQQAATRRGNGQAPHARAAGSVASTEAQSPGRSPTADVSPQL